jgi:hypothetical protein
MFFLLLFFCGAQNTVGKITTQGGMRKSCAYGKKRYPRMFLGTILLKVTQAKIFVSCIGFNLLIRLNIAFDKFTFTLLENTVQLQEVVIRQKSIH